MSAADIIRLLDLKPHPEGGHYRETFRDARAIEGGRAASTAIYFLLARDERSHWHRTDAVEIWHFYAGAPLKLEIALSARGPVQTFHLGANFTAGERPQVAVPAKVPATRMFPAASAASRRPVSSPAPPRTLLH